MNIFKRGYALSLLFLLLFINSSLLGQLFPNPINLATGQGAIGTLDPIWTCSQWFPAQPADPSGAVFIPALINNNCAPGSWVNPAALAPPMNNGNWITGQGPNCGLNTTVGYRFFRLEINLPADCNGFSVTEQGNYILTFTGYVDNQITDVFLNGSPLGISGGSYAVGSQLTITIDGPWQVGINYIDILIFNSPSADPNDPNPYGLLLVADATALENNDTDNDGVSDLYDECPCEAGNNAVGCFNPNFTCDIDLIRTTFANAGCIELEGCWDDCSMYFLNPQYLSGSAAQAFAQSLGSNLVSIHSADENACMLSDLNRLGYGAGHVIWIGFNDEAVEGQFVWYDQSPVTYTNWAPGEPNNSGGNEDCTQIYPGGGNPGTWNDLPCNGSNSMSIIEVNLCPVTEVTPPITMCAGASTTIEVTSTILGSFPYTYSWSNGSNQVSQVVSPTQTTDYHVTVTDRYNCQKKDSLTVSIFPPGTIDAGNDVAICINDNTTLTATGATSYSWDNGVVGASQTVSPIVTTTYTVTGTDGNGCTNTDQVTVTVNPLPTVNAGNDLAICLNDNTTLTATGATSYVWDNSLGAGASHTVSPTSDITYTVTGTDNNGCINTDQVTVTVNPLPSVSAIGSDVTVCFNDQTTLTGTGATSYVWDNGLGAGSSHTFVPAGTATYTVTGTDNNGCINTAQVFVAVNPLPTATINGTTEICEDDAEPQITFTGANGTAPYTFNYTINGGASQTVTTTSGNSITINAPTNAAGTFTYNLVSVQDASSTTCLNNASGTAIVTVNPLPTATVNGSTDVCQGDAEPQITFVGTDGTAPYTFIYTLNGGVPQTVSTTSGNSVTVTVPTTTTGTYNYNLVSVQDNSSTTCLNNASGTAIVVVNPLPTATISGSTAVCQGDAEPQITFTGANATSPYTFTYTINGGVSQTVSTTSGNSVTVDVPTINTGTYTYELVSIQDASAAACVNTVSTVATVIVNSTPTGTIMDSDRICQFEALTIEFEGTNSTGDYTFTYTLNNGSNQTITTNGGSTATVNVPTNAPGIFDYELINVEDPATGCNSSLSQIITIEVLAQPKAIFHPNPSVLTSYNGESQMVNESTNSSYYYWDFGDGFSSSSHSPIHEFPNDKTANYKVMLIASDADGMCIDTSYQIVQFKNELLFYVPNSFTPDGDELNNVFLPILSAGYDPDDYTLFIFNRWGEMLFESHDTSVGWDGTYNGKIVKSGTYVWKIEVQKTMTATREVFSGIVNLLR